MQTFTEAKFMDDVKDAVSETYDQTATQLSASRHTFWLKIVSN